MTFFPPVLSPVECTRRLELIFPRASFDTVLSNPLAGTAIATMLYLGAINDSNETSDQWRYVRPAMVMWMNDEILAHQDPQERDAWFQASKSGAAKKRVTTLMEQWGLAFSGAYADNSRETLRDETFREWAARGALHQRAGLATTSSSPRWILDAEFAALFHTDLDNDDDLIDAIDSWASTHMSKEGRLRAYALQKAADGDHAVVVLLPGGGGTRELEAGPSSVILKAVIEHWVPRKLRRPLILSIAESRQKQFVADKQVLAQLEIEIDSANLLPDCLIVDTDEKSFGFWIIEAVASDGPITEARKAELTHWAVAQGIPADQCHFLTAFEGRNSSPARRRLKDLAVGSHAWFIDEPEQELLWRPIKPMEPVNLAVVTPLRSRS